VEGAISDAQREDIVRSLATVGVDANAVTVGCRFVPGVRQWSVNEPGVPRRPLRAVLDEMAYCYILSEHYKPPAAWQRAKQFEKTRVAVEEARGRLGDATFVFPHYPDRDLGVDQGKYDALEYLLTWAIADLQWRTDRLSAGGSSSKQNAQKRYSEYWHGLTQLWRAIVCKGKPLRKKLLRQFLLACSQPLSTSINARTLGKKIDSFLSNLSHSKKRRS
jgi:hypothetical protein